LTVIDATTLTVIETLQIAPVASGWERMLARLGLVPQSARAKVSEGRSLRAAWSADGQSLYVLMPETPWWDNGGGSAYLLRRLDTGTLEATAERRLDAWPQVMLVPLGDVTTSR
ncbi:MAG: hypothetical protein M3457_14960, partial [Chloroflexota bacterium]|nr:hypothetical protein [Chloroflexota bacterium]